MPCHIRLAGAGCEPTRRGGILAAVDASALRAEFPVLRALAYLNAGTDGPLPERAPSQAAAARARARAAEGRAMAHFERRSELTAELRGAYATVLGCDAADVALTTCTSEGIAQVDRRPGAAPRR